MNFSDPDDPEEVEYYNARLYEPGDLIAHSFRSLIYLKKLWMGGSCFAGVFLSDDSCIFISDVGVARKYYDKIRKSMTDGAGENRETYEAWLNIRTL